MTKCTRIAGFLFPLLIVAGCGGGGSSGPTISPQPQPTLATLTADNAVTAASVAARQTVENDLFNALTGLGLPIAVASAGSNIAVTDVVKVARDPVSMATSESSQACAVSGSIDIVIDIENPLTLSPGDEFRLQLNQCDDGVTLTSGTIVMTVTAFDGNLASEQFLLGLSVSAQGFSVTSNGETSEASATMAFTIDTRNPPLTTITVTSALFASNNSGVVETLQDVTITISEDESMFPTSVSLTTSYRISSPSLDGDLLVSTSVALESSGDGLPYTGEITVEAADGATVVLVVLDENSVRIVIDVDGDGATDDTQDMTWDELLAVSAPA